MCIHSTAAWCVWGTEISKLYQLVPPAQIMLFLAIWYGDAFSLGLSKQAYENLGYGKGN